MDELTPQKWMQRIDRSLRLQKPRIEEAGRFLRAYAGDYGIKPQKSIEENKDEAVVNFVYSFVETIAPSIFGGMPRAFVEAMDPESELTADHYQATINYFARTLGMKRHFNQCRFDSFFGHTGMLTEWDFEEIQVEEPQISHVDPLTGKPVMGEPQLITKTLRDRPLVKRVAPEDIILDPDSKFRPDDRWRGMRITMTKDEFDKLDGVGSQMRKDIKGRSLSNDNQANPFGNKDQFSDSEWVVLYKIYDLATDTVKLLPEGENTKDFVEVKEWPWLFEVENDRSPLTILEAKFDSSNP